ncbi:MAG: hypothetical protein ACJ704_01755, partial [Nitrososphaeraceae archaeon]
SCVFLNVFSSASFKLWTSRNLGIYFSSPRFNNGFADVVIASSRLPPSSTVVTGNVGAIFNIIINAFILYYIYRPYVKSFFGKTTTTAAPTASMTR